MFNLYGKVTLSVIFIMGFGFVKSEIPLNPTLRLEMIDRVGEILCGFKTKMIYVYFENETSLSYPGQLLMILSKCNTAYVSLRNKYKVAPLEIINDDGVLMFLVMILRDATQPISLSIVRKQSGAKHLSHVLLLIADGRAIDDNWLRQTFQQFWKIWLLKVIIVYWRNDELQIYRYDPFATQLRLMRLSSTKSSAPARLSELFPTQLPNMNLHPLSICMYADEVRAVFDTNNGRLVGGIDGRFTQYVASTLNFTPIVRRVSSFSNRSADICFNEIRRELDDVALNARFLSPPTFHDHVESTIVHSRDDLCVLVPKAKTASTFFNLFRSFKPLVWALIALSLPIAYALCALLFRSYKCADRTPLFLQLYASALTMPWTHVPLQFSLRLFVFVWLFYGLLITGAFRGNLTSNLLFRTFLPDINTIQDLALSQYDLLMYSRHSKHLDMFLNDSSPYELMVKRKLRVVSDAELLGLIASNNVSHAYLEKYHLALFQATARQHSRQGRPRYHVMKTCLVPFHSVYIVPYGSPYLGFLNTLIRSSHEYGLNVYWERMATIRLIKSGKRIRRSRSEEAEDPVVLKLHHLQAAFFLWTLGLSWATVTFIWEHTSKRLFHKVWGTL